MHKLSPQDLKNMQDVTHYWRQCLLEFEEAGDSPEIAAHMVGVTINGHDQEWYHGSNSHPAYALVFELAAQLELTQGTPVWRQDAWQCIRALVEVLQQKYGTD